MTPVREARLRSASAGRYPFLPAQMWAGADRIAELIRRHLGVAPRPLDDDDFTFRGGEPHLPGAHTRLVDGTLTPAPGSDLSPERP